MSEAGRVPITFEPSGACAWVPKGESLLAAGRVAGVHISATCGGRGVCGACAVKVLSGALAPPTADEQTALRNGPRGVRLACRATVTGPVTVKPIVATLARAQVGSPTAKSELVAGVDLGTTTVSAVVLDRSTGRQVGVSVVSNRQQSFGADVLTRVSAALNGSAGELQRLAEESVLEALDLAAPGARTRLTRVVIAGNTAMSSLLAGADVSTLAAHPFAPPPGVDRLPPDSGLRDALHAIDIELVPPVAGFVGGDALAGMTVLDFDTMSGAHLLVDIGTNAEVALVKKGRISVTSAAAGPAFEGAGIANAGPPVDGAVVSVAVDEGGGITFGTVGGAAPTWFSGAGLISALAELRRSGNLTHEGRLETGGLLGTRVSLDQNGVAQIRLGGGDAQLTITQLDIRALQLAKAAVRVAITALLRDAAIRSARLDSVYVSGAFGGALDAADLGGLGIIPEDAVTLVEPAGNTSLQGAAAIALDSSLMERARSLAHAARHVDLATQTDFAQRLIEAVELEPYRV